MKSDIRLVSIDLLRGLAAFGIVGCHLMLDPRTDLSRQVMRLCDTNVGIFAALAGFLMVRPVDAYRETTWVQYIWRRFVRLAPAYLTWTALYLSLGMVYDLVLDHQLGANYFQISYWLRALFFGCSSTHLWFLPWLFYGQIGFFGFCENNLGQLEF